LRLNRRRSRRNLAENPAETSLPTLPLSSGRLPRVRSFFCSFAQTRFETSHASDLSPRHLRKSSRVRAIPRPIPRRTVARFRYLPMPSRRSVAPGSADRNRSGKSDPQTCAKIDFSTPPGARPVDNLTPRHPRWHAAEKVCYPNPRNIRSLSSCLTFAIPYLVKSGLQDTRCSV
jgi:hypothetical protein